MTPVTIRAGMATLTGECKRLVTAEPYPSSGGSQVISLFVTVDDPAMVCELQEAIGDVCETREANVHRLSGVDGGSYRPADLSEQQAMIERVRVALDSYEVGVNISKRDVRALLSAFDTCRAQLDIERRRK